MEVNDLLGLMANGPYDPQAIAGNAMSRLLRGQNTPQPQPVYRQMGPVQPQVQPTVQPQVQPQQPQAQPQPRRALPRAMANYTPPPPQAPATQPQERDWKALNDDLHARRLAAEAEEQAAMQPVDRSEMERIYQQRVQQGNSDMLKALAAMEGGKDFTPFTQHFVRASEEAQSPLKMQGGTLTPQGFIEDPGFVQDQRLKRAQAKLLQIERVEQFYLSAEERDRMQKEKLKWEGEMRDAQMANARQIASIAAGNRASNEPLVQVLDPASGNPMYVRRSEAVGMQPPPKGSGQPTEDERKSASLLQRLEFSEQQLKTALAEHPKAATPNPILKMVGEVPLVGETAANAFTSEARQRVEGAQLDLLDAALTLGTGQAYTKEQLRGYAKSYFPQPGDEAAAIADKQARLSNVIQSAKVRAGRALPPSGTTLTNAPPAGPTATGPNGQKIQLVNGQWVPMR